MIKFNNLETLLALVESRTKAISKRAGAAFVVGAGEKLKRLSQEEVPKKTWHLHDSAEVSPPSTQGLETSARLSYEAEYAIPVHERTEARGAKYLQKPIDNERREIRAHGVKAAKSVFHGKR